MALNKDLIQTIRNKEMDRKDFLKYSGLVLLSVVGLKTVASLFTQAEKTIVAIESPKESPRGFGSGKYGA